MINIYRLLAITCFLLFFQVSHSQHIEQLTSGNFHLQTSSRSGFVAYSRHSPGMLMPYQPFSKSYSNVFYSSMNFVGLIDSNIYTHGVTPFNTYVLPGPILKSGDYPAEYKVAFDTVWVVKRQELQRFLEDWKDGSIDDDHPTIFDWPAKGNPVLLKNKVKLPKQELAPFYDRNKNGIYEPQLGDYPSHIGNLKDKAIPTYLSWSVYNTGELYYDGLNSHLGNIEVHTIAYAYACNQNPILNQSAYFKLKVFNRNKKPIQDFKIPVFYDGDIGCGNNDYWGTDTSSQSIYFYSDTIKVFGGCDYTDYLPNRIKVANSITILNHELGSSNDFTVNDILLDHQYERNNYSFYKLAMGNNVSGLRIPYGWGSPFESDSVFTKYLFTDRPSHENGWHMKNTELSLPNDFRPYATIFSSEIEQNEKIEIDLAIVSAFDSTDTFDNYTIVDRLLDENLPEAIQAYESDFTTDMCDYSELCSGLKCTWPGDSNNDESVFIDDFIHTGWLLKGKYSGPSRIYPTAEWLPFSSLYWGLSFRDTDLKHADASGDGQIEINDLDIIEENILRTTPWYQNEMWEEPASSEVSLKVMDAEVMYGITFLEFIPISIKIGSESFPVDNLHSICFTLDLTSDLLKVDDINNRIVSIYSNDNNVERLSLLKVESQKCHFAVTELHDTSYNGNFEILKAWVYLRGDLTTSNPDGIIRADMKLKNVKALDIDGIEIPLKLENGSLKIENVTTTTSVDELSTGKDFSIYPNPATDRLHLQPFKKGMNFKIINSHGLEMKQGFVKEESINISSLPSGIYFIFISKEGQGAVVRKFIKE